MSLHTIAHEISKAKKKWWTVQDDIVWVGKDFPCPAPHSWELSPSDHHGCMNLRWPDDVIHYCECSNCASEYHRHYFQDNSDNYQCYRCEDGECPNILDAGLAAFVGSE